MIYGVVGLQGAGKTSFLVYIGRQFQRLGADVYTNMSVEDFVHIRDFSEIPFDRKFKILLIDEAMFSFDSRSFGSKDNKIFSRFLAYLRKQNTGLIWATHFLGLVDVRLRMQTEIYYMVKKRDERYIDVLAMNAFTSSIHSMSIEKSPRYFSYLRYDTADMPSIVTVQGLLQKNEFIAV